MAVPVETGPSFTAGTPKILFQGEYTSIGGGVQYSVTPDGKRFLMIKEPAATTSSEGGPRPKINVVMNWFEELKQRAPVK